MYNVGDYKIIRKYSTEYKIRKVIQNSKIKNLRAYSSMAKN